MNRCRVCIYPDTRPDTHFVDGVCSACRSYAADNAVDWDARLTALNSLLKEARAKGAPYDCVVPVSGGKDSTYQVVTLIDLGARVLAVNSGTDMPSAIGRRNLDNLKRYCDVIEVTPNVEVRKRLVRVGLERVGDMSWPEHLAIWSIPTRMAVALGIPLVVWGEQPQREYATPAGVVPATRLDARWVAEFGGLNGLRPQDLIDEGLFSAADLAAFRFPTDAELEAAGVEGIWLGDYIRWDGWRNALVAQAHGFETLPGMVEGSLADYENLDNHVTVLRDWLRYLKFGYSRATDIACNHVRRGRLTRAEALALVAGREQFPTTSLGKPLAEVLAYFGLTVGEFQRACDKWTNPDIFEFGLDMRPWKWGDHTPKIRADAGPTHYPAAAE